MVAAALELGRRLARLTLVREPLLDRPEVVADYLARSFGSARVEQFGAITLDARNRLLRVHELHRGGRSHPRQVGAIGRERLADPRAE